MAQHNALGQQGERLAVSFLKQKGYRILAQNFRYRRYEVDIIAHFDNQIIVVEVKTRSSAQYGDPKDFLQPKQIQHLQKAVNYFVISRDIDLEVRFDIISIVLSQTPTENTLEQLEHIEDAFYIF